MEVIKRFSLGCYPRYLYLLLLCLLLPALSSCSTSVHKLVDSSERFYRKGFSILPPQGTGWQVKDGYQQKVTFYKKGDSPKSSYVVMAYSKDHPLQFGSEEEFFSVMGKLRLAMEFRPKRNLILEKKVALAPAVGKYCLKSYSKMKDFGKKGKTNKDYLLMENFGLICLHPSDKAMLVNFAVTHRYPPGAKDQNFKMEVDNIISSLKLEPIERNAPPASN